MSAFVFRIACPRCETAVDIHLDKSNYECSRCAFVIEISDPEDMLRKFKSGDVEDVDFVESPIKGESSMMDAGLKLSFSKLSSSSSISAKDNVEAPKADEEVDVDEFGNKTANTQVIQLTFDPAKFLEEMQTPAAPAKGKKKKISLKKVIKHGELAKPPVASPQEKMIKVVTISAIVLLVVIMAIFLSTRA
ncbi:MAG: hypothetical protein NE330_05760 [Lentisphaeraceae bacterium]|nr:hypothetical protein [Lentisphaeraceae bacterium]